ncbi:MAG: radical SAM protein, partial [Clostridia bacterium]|nr:radical SAM protein [Clostridia bacterium]
MVNCVYLHIPFCEKKCKYCAFCSFGLINKKGIYLNSLTNEIKNTYKGELLKTIYFGCVTPSLLEVNDIKKILDLLNFNSKTEITLELNPHLITKEKLKDFYNIGINRLSIGVQSFNDDILAEIGRTHTS